MLAAIGGITLAAAGSSDPVVATWQLNASKSKFTSGPAIKSQTRTYSQVGESLTLVTKSVSADGKESTVTTTYQTNGKDFPITGTPDYDTLAGKQVDANTAKFTFKKDGKVVGGNTRTVSRDGRTLTSTMKYTAVSGQKVNSVLVFDRK
jgi:hypothetical protein